MPNMTIGFLPIRSAAIPQTVEVKHLPSINEAPENIKQKVENIVFNHLKCVNQKFRGLTHKSGIEPYIFCSFCNMQVSYLSNKR